MRTISKISSFALIVAVLALTAGPGDGQSRADLPRIGFLSVGSASGHQSYREEFLAGLKDLGYLNGQTVVIEYRYANRKRSLLPGLARELARLNVSVIVAGGTSPIRAAIDAADRIPIVMVSGGNPVSRGFVQSFSRPGGNVTGLSSAVKGIHRKRLDFLREIKPSLSRVAVLNPRRKSRSITFYEYAAGALGVKLQVMDARTSAELQGAFEKISALRPDALLTLRNNFTIANAQRIAEFAVNNHLPSMFESKDFLNHGGLMSYGVSYLKMWRRAAVFVDKILKGADPSTLPVEPPKVELIINLKTAKELNLTIPPELHLTVDEIIK